MKSLHIAEIFLAALSLAFLIVAIAVLTGILNIPATNESHFVDMQLIRSASYHGVLGVFTISFQWLVGYGLLWNWRPARDLGVERLALYSVPVSIPALALGLLLAQTSIFGVLVASFGGVALAVIAIRHILSNANRDNLIIGVVLALSAVVYGVWISIFKHGPTGILNAWTGLDPVFYASQVRVLSEFGWPAPNLNYEGSIPQYFNLLWSGSGAALSGVVPLDPFQFIVASTNAAFIFMTGLGTWLFSRVHNSEQGSKAPSSFALPTVIIAVLIGTFYVSWIGHSPPMLYVTALAISFWLILKDFRSLGSEDKAHGIFMFVLLATCGLLAPLLTKVVLFGAFVPIIGAAILTDYFRRGRKSQKTLVLGAALVAATALVGASILGLVINLDAYSYLRPASTGWTYHTGGIPGAWRFILRDISIILVGIAFIWIRPGLMSIGLLAILIITVLFPVFLFAAAIASCLFIALESSTVEAPKPLARALLFFALCLSVPQVILGDPAGTIVAAGWVICLLIPFYMSRHGTLPIKRFLVVPLAALSSLSLLTVAAANGQLPVKSGYWAPVANYPALTPSMRDIWQKVAACTPRNTLIFTDQTGRTISLTAYWNTYAQFGQRQVFVAGLGQAIDVIGDDEKVDLRLTTNAQVLNGDLSPESVDTSNDYTSFAMVSVSSAPDQWQEIYRNEQYILSVPSGTEDMFFCGLKT